MLEENVHDKYYYSDRFKVFDEIEKGITKNISENVLYQYRRYYVRENKSNCCPTLTANMGGGGHNVPLLKDDKGIRKLTFKENVLIYKDFLKIINSQIFVMVHYINWLEMLFQYQ